MTLLKQTTRGRRLFWCSGGLSPGSCGLRAEAGPQVEHHWSVVRRPHGVSPDLYNFEATCLLCLTEVVRLYDVLHR